MHPPINVPPTSWEKAILKWALIVIIGFLIGTTVISQYDDYRLGRAERELADAACAMRPDPDGCRK